MVAREDIPKVLPAACCKVDVVKGGKGRRLYGLEPTDSTTKSVFFRASDKFCAVFSSTTITPSFSAAAVNAPFSSKSFEPATRVPSS